MQTNISTVFFTSDYFFFAVFYRSLTCHRTKDIKWLIMKQSFVHFQIPYNIDFKM